MPTPSPLSRAPRRDAADNRAAIIAAAATLLRADPDPSVEAIASEAGLSRRTLYGHFPTRDDIVTEVLAIGAARIAASVSDVVRLSRAARRTSPHATDDPALEIALLGIGIWSEVGHVRVVAQLALRDPYKTTVARALEPVRALLLDTVERGVDGGRLRQDIAPRTLAHLVERAAISVLEESSATPMTDDDGERLVMVSGLGAAGFGWREAGEIAATAAALPRGPRSIGIDPPTIDDFRTAAPTSAEAATGAASDGPADDENTNGRTR